MLGILERLFGWRQKSKILVLTFRFVPLCAFKLV